MLYYLNLASVGLPAIIALIRIRQINKMFYPFVILLWFGLINEGLSYFTSRSLQSNGINANIYVLLEGLILLWMFDWWNRLNNKWVNAKTLAVLFIAVWAYEFFILHSIYEIRSLYRAVYSFVIVFLAVDQLNFTVIRHRGNLLKEPTFLICTGIIIFFTYKAIIEIFYLFPKMFTEQVFTNMYIMFGKVNYACNIIFLIAILWIQKRRKFIMPY